MLNATQLRIDYEVGAAYVKYRALEPGERVATSARLTEDLVIDYDREGRVLGMQLIALNDEAVESAKAFAEQNGLDIPQSLSSAVVTPITVSFDALIDDSDVVDFGQTTREPREYRELA